MSTKKDSDEMDVIEAKGLTLGTDEEKLAVFRGMTPEVLIACSILLQGRQILIEKKACLSYEEKQKIDLIKGNLKLIRDVICKNCGL